MAHKNNNKKLHELYFPVTKYNGKCFELCNNNGLHGIGLKTDMFTVHGTALPLPFLLTVM
jgi:hypothetical protein